MSTPLGGLEEDRLVVEERTVLAVPGANFGPSVPQVFLPALAAVRRGATLRMMEWQHVEQVESLSGEERSRWVRAQVAPHLGGADPAGFVVVAKSLGSYSAGLVAELGLPAIWVTPLLTESSVAEALREAPAPFLLVGGTADPWWDRTIALELTPRVLELTGADHGLLVPGPLRRSTDNLGKLTDACEAFLDEVVWPIGTAPS